MAGQFLTGGQQQLLEMAKLMGSGASFVQAAASVGFKGSPTTFVQAVTKLLNNPALPNALSAAARQSLSRAAQSAAAQGAIGAGAVGGVGAAGGGAGGAGAGGAAAGGVITSALTTIGGWFGLTGTAALMAGALVVTAVLGAATYGASTWAGGRSGDAPVQPGAGATQQRRDPPPPPGVMAAGGNEQYAVFLAPGPFGGDVLVGQKSVIEARPSCRLQGWGVDCTKTVGQTRQLQQVLGPFKTAAEAVKAFCDKVERGSQRRPPLQPNVLLMKFAGEDRNVINSPACGS